MKTNLTLKQRRFWKEYLKTQNLASAAKAAGSKGKDLHCLSECGRQILKSLELKMAELLDAQGLTDENLNKTLSDGLNAKHTVVATFQGKIGEEKSFVDHPTRVKYLDIAHRLRGNFIDRHEVTGKEGGELVIVVGESKKKKEKTIDL